MSAKVTKRSYNQNFPQYLTKLLPEGKREKEAVWFSSDNWLYTTRTGDTPPEADLLKYRNALWEVLVVRPLQQL